MNFNFSDSRAGDQGANEGAVLGSGRGVGICGNNNAQFPYLACWIELTSEAMRNQIEA